MSEKYNAEIKVDEDKDKGETTYLLKIIQELEDTHAILKEHCDLWKAQMIAFENQLRELREDENIMNCFKNNLVPKQKTGVTSDDDKECIPQIMPELS